MSLIRSHIRKASESQLSFAKFRILSNVNRGLNTVGELAGLQFVSQPAISKLVDSLVCENYLTRHHSKEDRRVIVLKLTREGKQKFQKVKSAASKDFKPIIDLLSEKEITRLEEALSCLESIFEKVQENKI